MNKKTLLYGLIAGFISSLWLILIPFLNQTEFDYSMGMVYGYAAMLLAFVFIFVAIKQQRDKQQEGIITFKQAFLTGCIITCIASTMYVLTWLIDYYFFIPDFFETLSKSYTKELQDAGKTLEDLEAAQKEMANYKELYKNPFYNAAFTYLEILPLGLIVSVLAALILKRKKTSI